MILIINNVFPNIYFRHIYVQDKNNPYSVERRYDRREYYSVHLLLYHKN